MKKSVAVAVLVVLIVLLCGCDAMFNNSAVRDCTIVAGGDIARIATVNVGAMDSVLFECDGIRYYGYKLGDLMRLVNAPSGGTVMLLGKTAALEMPVAFASNCYLARSMAGFLTLYNTLENRLTNITGLTEIVFLSEDGKGGIPVSNGNIVSYRYIMSLLYTKTGTARYGTADFTYYTKPKATYARKLLVDSDYTAVCEDGSRLTVDQDSTATLHWLRAKLYIIGSETPIASIKM